jgi:hypothetical protein
MEHLDYPDRSVWSDRCNWFNDLLEEKQGWGQYMVSEQAAALSSELLAVFCCGAWYTVIILSMAVIEAQIREYELPGQKGSVFQLAKQMSINPDFDWLRKQRNALVHLNTAQSGVSMDDYSLKGSELEQNAKRAIHIVFDALFMSPGV